MKPEAVYCSLNPVTNEAFERCPNQFQRAQRGVKLACNGADISRRAWILIDFDPIRPPKVYATDEEKSLALAKMRAVRDYLLSEGAPPMVEADSGNGCHLLLPCDLPNNKDSAQLVRGFLEFLSAKFSDAQVKVDTVNWNADRITKAYGTKPRKGPDMPERPHRHHLVCAKNNLASGKVVTYDFVIEGKPGSAGGGMTVSSTPVIKWLGESDVTMDSLLTQPRHPKEQPLLEEIATQIEAELQKRDRPAADIVATLVRAGYAKRSIERAKALLILNKVMDKPVNRDGSWYWRLAKQGKKGD